jgi:hypothetical protein
LIGDAFLKHFYSVYDFDKDTLSLGINQHSVGKVSMYKPGSRPDNLLKIQTEDSDESLIQTNAGVKTRPQVALTKLS